MLAAIICCQVFYPDASAGGHTALYLLRLTSALFREKQRQMLLNLNDLGYSERNGYNDFVEKKEEKCRAAVSIAEWPAAIQVVGESVCGTSLHKFHRRLLSSAKVQFLFILSIISVQGNRPTCFSYKWPVANRKRMFKIE
jgi:hypothetical protein